MQITHKKSLNIFFFYFPLKSYLENFQKSIFLNNDNIKINGFDLLIRIELIFTGYLFCAKYYVGKTYILSPLKITKTALSGYYLTFLILKLRKLSKTTQI